ncbi:hypothetical protein BDV12DRAFT_191474 [Aspergillus spectabilis]
MATPTPVVPAPPGVTPDFNTPHIWLRTANRVIVVVGLVISSCCLIMRTYTKTCIMRKIWWDDFCIIVAWIFALITQTLILYGYDHGGIGVHIWNLTVPTFNVFQKAVLAAAIIYIPALAFAKLAIIMLYYRLLNPLQPYRYLLWFIAAIITSYSVALMLALIFACHPIERAWNVAITTGSCIDRPAVYLATAITNTVSDVILIIVPIPAVIGLHLPRIQKIGVICIFAVGCLTIITSILRLATLMPLVTSPDPSYKLALASIFINIEANFIIICGCLPYIRQFLRYHAPKCIGEDRRRCSGQDPSDKSDPKRRRKAAPMELQDDIELQLFEIEEVHDLGPRRTPLEH